MSAAVKPGYTAAIPTQITAPGHVQTRIGDDDRREAHAHEGMGTWP